MIRVNIGSLFSGMTLVGFWSSWLGFIMGQKAPDAPGWLFLVIAAGAALAMLYYVCVGDGE